jgi:two-component system, OmpR family, sensor kinase
MSDAPTGDAHHPPRAPRLALGAGLTSLRNKLALLFLAVTAVALAVVIFFFLPQLHSKLVDQKLEDLQLAARRQSGAIGSVLGRSVPQPQVKQLIRSVADSIQGRVTLIGLQQSGPPATQLPYLIWDSNGSTHPPIEGELIAKAAVVGSGGKPPAALTGNGGEVAVPLYYAGQPRWVAVFSRQFNDAADVVGLVRDRLLVASAVALLVALLGGYLVARVLSRRVRRVELAARELASGRQVEPLPVETNDELGRLASAFNEMQDQLQRVDRARREFIANASHELRTPIFSLSGFVELLQDEQLDPATRDEFLQVMAEQVDRLQKLAVDLLDLSRLDAGSIDMDLEQVDMSELAGAVVQEFRPALANHRTPFEVRYSEQPLSARCDRQRAAQIMRILLDNALRHTPEGTPVTVTTDRDNGAVEFAVTDRGPGIDAASREQLFERFHTGDAARGSGLGLAIAKELAERMDGYITVQSRPGKTVFRLALPPVLDDMKA